MRLGVRFAIISLSYALLVPAIAGERIVIGSDNYKEVEIAAYSRAMKLPPIDPTGGDQIRAWFMGYWSGHMPIVGYVLTAKSARLMVPGFGSSVSTHARARKEKRSLRCRVSVFRFLTHTHTPTHTRRSGWRLVIGHKRLSTWASHRPSHNARSFGRASVHVLSYHPRTDRQAE